MGEALWRRNLARQQPLGRGKRTPNPRLGQPTLRSPRGTGRKVEPVVFFFSSPGRLLTNGAAAASLRLRSGTVSKPEPLCRQAALPIQVMAIPRAESPLRLGRRFF